MPRALLAATPAGVVRLEERGGWRAELVHPRERTSGVALDGETAYASSRAGGVARSRDGVRAWEATGLEGLEVTAVAARDGLVVAGTAPTGVYRSEDGGRTWEELEAFRRIPSRRFWFFPGGPPFQAYVASIALAPGALVVGVEAGAVVRSADGGRRWEDHRPGALRDCHQLVVSPGRETIYEAGGNGGGTALSEDGGATWQRAPLEQGRRYAVAVAAGGETWYAASAPGPFAAHRPGHAGAAVYRRDGARWTNLTPALLAETPFGLAAPEPGRLFVGLRNGDLLASDDGGDTLAHVCTAPAAIRALVATTR